MQLTVLVDNATLTDRYFAAEPGVSYLIEEAGARILFDVGYSDLFLRNAQRMGLDLRTVHYLVLSHGHLDHSWGLDTLMRLQFESTLEQLNVHKPTLIAHPEVFATRGFGPFAELGAATSERKAARHFDMRLTREPLWLTEKLLFLGEIPRYNEFEGVLPLGNVIAADSETPDLVADDTGLAYRGAEGLVIIVGCSHAGICNIVEHARLLTGEQRVSAIFGGLHLLEPSAEQLEKTCAYIGGLNLRALHACHCTDLASKIALAKVAPLEEVGVGLRLNFD